MSKVTSICGMPRGAGGMPSRMNRPSVLLSAAKSRSPWRTWISTCDCESDAVEKTCDLLRRDGRVALDQLGHDAAERLDPERQRGHVEEQDVLDVAGQDAGLDRRADRHDLVRVDALVRLLAAEHLLDRFDDRRHAGHAADEDHLVDVGGLEAGVLERGLDRPLGLGHEVGHQVLELGPGEGHDEVLGAGRVGGDVGQVDLGGCRGRELDLRLLGGFLEALQGLLVLGQVDPLVLLVFGQQPVDDALVEVVAAEVRIAVGRLDLEDALAELEDRDVEGAAAQVVDGDLLVALLVQAVGEGRRGGLVDDPLDVEPGDPAGVLGRLALGVVEVGRDGDDGLGHLLAQVRLGVRAQLLEDHRADLGRRVGLAVGQLDHHAVALGVLLDVVRDQALAALGFGIVPAAAHEALDRVDGVGRVGHRLALGQLADEAFAGLGEGDDGRYGPATLRRSDDGRLAALHDGDDRVRRAEIDADDLAHVAWCSSVCGCVGGCVGGCGDGHQGRTDDPVAQAIAAPDLFDDLALGPTGVGHVDDRLVFARVERAAG